MATADKNELENAVASLQDAELKSMCERLAKQAGELEEFHEVLQAEQKELREDNENLRATIESMLKETHKLHIGSMNTKGPVLEENPLNAVNRLWEKVRPRDTAYVVDEHTGEIVRPVPASEQVEVASALPDVLEAASNLRKSLGEGAEQLQQRVGPAANRLREEIGPAANRLREEIGPAANRLRDEIGPAANRLREEHLGPAANRVKSTVGGLWTAGYKNVEGWWNAPPTEEPGPLRRNLQLFGESFVEAATHQPSKPKSMRSAKKGDKSSKTAGEPRPPPAQMADAETTAGSSSSSSLAEALDPFLQQEPPASPRPEEKPSSPAKPEEPQEEQISDEQAREEQISSTILIEARLTLSEGNVQMLRVRAADRCKQVAAAFVKENALEPKTEKALTAWLKKAEAEAEKFPLVVEASLDDIIQGRA
eukprot:gnl/TRDRNA2_/TRDRNA2_86028_c1_seq1.p1 gnl/TRDRNA2_/TRDRNA2_86028_c1~~gnl/TRDRNA2_/TRDRNA2_86028_c1_seq1.p1  ORF type:complete len:425 (+),score=126.22 gnl/TRDRNA2_/TRDRNA2_86028_c1_seq1:53-1327(+)